MISIDNIFSNLNIGYCMIGILGFTLGVGATKYFSSKNEKEIKSENIEPSNNNTNTTENTELSNNNINTIEDIPSIEYNKSDIVDKLDGHELCNSITDTVFSNGGHDPQTIGFFRRLYDPQRMDFNIPEEYIKDVLFKNRELSNMYFCFKDMANEKINDYKAVCNILRCLSDDQLDKLLIVWDQYHNLCSNFISSIVDNTDDLSILPGLFVMLFYVGGEHVANMIELKMVNKFSLSEYVRSNAELFIKNKNRSREKKINVTKYMDGIEKLYEYLTESIKSKINAMKNIFVHRRSP